MPPIPQEPEAFTERIVRLFRKALGKRNVAATGPLTLVAEGRIVELDDLHRATLVTADRDPTELVDSFIDTMLASWRLEQTPLPYDVARTKILPHIASFNQLCRLRAEHPAAQPYINETYIIYVIDLGPARAPVTVEQLVRWGVEPESIDELARRNLAAYQPQLELKLVQGDGASAAVFNTGDGYDASRILLDELHPQVAPELGGDFLVAIPSRDVFIAFPIGHGQFIDRLRQRVAADFRKLPYPITDQIFLITRDGVAAWPEAA